MTTPDETGLKYGTIVGRYLLSIEDSPDDLDKKPDSFFPSGIVTCTPILPSAGGYKNRVLDGSVRIVIPKVIKGKVHRGEIVDEQNSPGITLLSQVNDQYVQYQIKVEIKDNENWVIFTSNDRILGWPDGGVINIPDLLDFTPPPIPPPVDPVPEPEPEPELIQVTATAPTWADNAESGGGSWTTPTITGVTYTPANGTASPGQAVTINASAKAGYVLSGTVSWTHTFPTKPVVVDPEEPDPISVSAPAPTWGPDNESGGGTWTTTATTGVVYSAPSGTASPGQYITITATAAEGYVLVGTSSWSFAFPDVPAAAPSPARYWDVEPFFDSIDNGMPVTLAPGGTDFIQAYGITLGIQVASEGGVLDGTFSAEPLPLKHPNTLWAIKIILDEVSKYPPAVFKALSLKKIVLTGAIFETANPEAKWGGFAISEAIYLGLGHTRTSGGVYDDGSSGMRTLVQHEIMHIINRSDKSFFNNLKSEWTALNVNPYDPDGWQNADSSVRPEGHVRTYGLGSYEEDQADVWAVMTVARTAANYETILAEDSILSAKVGLMKSWFMNRFPASIKDDFFDAVTDIDSQVFDGPKPIGQGDTWEDPDADNGALKIVAHNPGEAKTQLRDGLIAAGIDPDQTQEITIPIDTSQSTDLSFMFEEMRALRVVPSIDTSNVTNMEGMFQLCISLQTIPWMDTSKVTSMKSMFSKAMAINTLPMLDVLNVKDMELIFFQCASLRNEKVPLWDTSNVETFREAFRECYITDTVPWSLDSALILRGMYRGCTSLANINLPEMPLAQNLIEFFSGCWKIAEFPTIVAPSIVTTAYMFVGCTKLEYVAPMQTSGVTDASYMFHNCTLLADGAVALIGKNPAVATGNMIDKTKMTRLPFFNNQGQPI